MKKLRAKVKMLERDLKDHQKEQEGDREELLDTIRAQEKDLDFYQGVLAMLLTKNELYKIKEKVEFDFETNKWIVPPFILKNKEVQFPKISNAMSLVEQHLEERELQFPQNETQKFSFDRPAASIMSTGKQVIPRNKILFQSVEGVSPDKQGMLAFQIAGKKQTNDNYHFDEFAQNKERNTNRKENSVSTLTSGDAVASLGMHRQDFVIRKSKHKYQSAERQDDSDGFNPVVRNQNNLKLQPLNKVPFNNGSEPGSGKH